MPPPPWLVAVACGLALAGCRQDPAPQVSPSATPVATLPHDLRPVPGRVKRLCREARLPCPCTIPRTEPQLPSDVSGEDPTTEFRSIDITIGAPTRRLSQRNAPPGFLHLQSLAGRLSEEGGVLALQSRPRRWTSLTELPKKRRAPLLLGTREWGGVRGEVFLAPPFPFGAVESDHLLFLWEEDGEEFAIALHAWLPLSASLRTFEAVVGTIPDASSAAKCP